MISGTGFKNDPCTVWKVVNDTLKKLTANLTTQLYSKFQSNLRKDLPLQNGFIGPLDYKFMYLVHAIPPYNCDLELGQNHYIKWHFFSFQINFLLCLVYKLVKKNLIGDTLTIISPPKKESVKNMRLSCCVEMPHSGLLTDSLLVKI